MIREIQQLEDIIPRARRNRSFGARHRPVDIQCSQHGRMGFGCGNPNRSDYGQRRGFFRKEHFLFYSPLDFDGTGDMAFAGTRYLGGATDPR